MQNVIVPEYNDNKDNSSITFFYYNHHHQNVISDNMMYTLCVQDDKQIWNNQTQSIIYITTDTTKHRVLNHLAYRITQNNSYDSLIPADNVNQ